MIEFFEKCGILSLGSRMRWLSDLIIRDAAEIYRLYGLEIKPKWFPVLYMLFNGDDNSVTGIARAIGQTHPSVSNLVRELAGAGLVTESKDETDRRTSVISLTDKGLALKPQLDRVCDDVRNVAASIDAGSAHPLWEAISSWEESLSEKRFLTRVAQEKARHTPADVEIVDYRPEYLQTFKRLNIMWINSHWSLEPHDLETLGDPQGTIISRGGYIFVALYGGKPAGVVALCPMNHPEYDYELAKLAVDPDFRGKGIGKALCAAVLGKARALGAGKLFLESNTLLKPAITLYRRLGFTELKEYHPAYERGDIQMELDLRQ